VGFLPYLPNYHPTDKTPYTDVPFYPSNERIAIRLSLRRGAQYQVLVISRSDIWKHARRDSHERISWSEWGPKHHILLDSTPFTDDCIFGSRYIKAGDKSSYITVLDLAPNLDAWPDPQEIFKSKGDNTLLPCQDVIDSLPNALPYRCVRRDLDQLAQRNQSWVAADDERILLLTVSVFVPKYLDCGQFLTAKVFTCLQHAGVLEPELWVLKF
jgi:hypothetical protein